jgi:transposase-like protein
MKTVMQLYFSGESLRKTAESLKLIGMNVTHQTIYIGLMQYLDSIELSLSTAFLKPLVICLP